MAVVESGVNDLLASAKGEFGGMKHLARDAVHSKAYLYPFKVCTAADDWLYRGHY
jgi:hypothetical protein